MRLAALMVASNPECSYVLILMGLWWDCTVYFGVGLWSSLPLHSFLFSKKNTSSPPNEHWLSIYKKKTAHNFSSYYNTNQLYCVFWLLGRKKHLSPPLQKKKTSAPWHLVILGTSSEVTHEATTWGLLQETPRPTVTNQPISSRPRNGNKKTQQKWRYTGYSTW